MAEPTEFKEQNFVYAKPRNMSSDECGDLPCHVYEGGVISKWEFNEAELEQIKESGFVFVCTLDAPPPPIWVSGLNPFSKIEIDFSKPANDFSKFIELVKHAAKYAFFLHATEQEEIDADEFRELSKLLKAAIHEAKIEATKEMVEGAKNE